MIKIILKSITDLKCECINDYIFNRTHNFSGVIFKKHRQYRFDKPDIRCKNTNLVAVINDFTDSYVGMSIERFNEHFVVLLNTSDNENKELCIQYNINYNIQKG